MGVLLNYNVLFFFKQISLKVADNLKSVMQTPNEAGQKEPKVA